MNQMRFKVSVSYRDYKKKSRAKMQVNNSSTFAFQTQQKRRRLEEEKKIENSNLVGGGGSHSPPTVTSTDFCIIWMFVFGFFSSRICAHRYWRALAAAFSRNFSRGARTSATARV